MKNIAILAIIALCIVVVGGYSLAEGFKIASRPLASPEKDVLAEAIASVTDLAPVWQNNNSAIWLRPVAECQGGYMATIFVAGRLGDREHMLSNYFGTTVCEKADLWKLQVQIRAWKDQFDVQEKYISPVIEQLDAYADAHP